MSDGIVSLQLHSIIDGVFTKPPSTVVLDFSYPL
jgi:hypothetical protein